MKNFKSTLNSAIESNRVTRSVHSGMMRDPFEGESSGLAVWVLFAVFLLGLSPLSSASPVSDWGPSWTKTGELILPENYHAWIFLGSPLTPNALNNGKAGFPEYHNVYIQPQAYEEFLKTGQFPDGTILLKELQLTLPGTNPDGSRSEPSGRGFFPAGFNGIDISVKDSKKFINTEGWGFFNFGHHAPPYEATASVQAKDACAGCHMANADNMVFKKFYPRLSVVK